MALCLFFFCVVSTRVVALDFVFPLKRAQVGSGFCFASPHDIDIDGDPPTLPEMDDWFLSGRAPIDTFFFFSKPNNEKAISTLLRL